MRIFSQEDDQNFIEDIGKTLTTSLEKQHLQSEKPNVILACDQPVLVLTVWYTAIHLSVHMPSV